MSYKDKPQVKLYKFENNAFILNAIIDDFQDISFECNRYRAGQFTITINYNIPNALLFERGLWVQIGDNPYNFGEILNVTDAVGQDGKGSQIRTITGYDARYIFKRRVIKNLNNESNWVMTAKGEICMRSLILDQCGANAESKRQLPVENVIPSAADAIGKEYSVAESFSNLYEVLCTIATQSEIGWRVKFSDNALTLEFYQGEDKRDTVRFDTSFESLAQGQFTDSAESFANSVYVGGKGTGSDRDIYEGENGSPEGLDRYEAWDNQSGMTTEDEYEAEALSILSQYSQTLTVSGQGLAKNPYVYGKQYNVGDIITIAFSGKSAAVQILSVTEHWSWGSYNIEFSFGKPQPDLNNQLQLILKQIQKASDKTSTTDSVKWYTIPTDTGMPSADVVYNTIGFVGTCAGGGSTFTLYLDDEKTGAKTYHVYLKQLAGGSLTLTTGKAGASNLVLNSGTYVAIIYIDENGNITSQGSTAVNSVQSGNWQPVTSDAVYNAISGIGAVTGVKGDAESTYRTGNVNLTPANIGAATPTDITNAIQALDVASVGGSGKYISAISETDGKISATASNLATSIASGNSAPVTSGAVYDAMAFSHNIPRLEPKNITSYVTDGTLWNRLNGTNGYALFEDIYVGDYFEMSRAISAYEKTGAYQTTGSKFVTIAGIDTMWGNGDSDVMSKHHLVMVPGQGFGGTQHFGCARMNASNDTTGGYKASEMNVETLGAVASSGSTAATASINQQLYAEFGAHLQTTRELVSDTLNASGINRFGGGSNLGCSSSWGWISAQAVLMSEIEVYGATVWSSSGYDAGNANRQLPLFAFSKQAQNNRTAWYWLKDVASATYFCNAHGDGISGYNGASKANYYVRPRFVLA